MIDVQSASESYRVLQRILACAETIETALRRAEAATHITATDAAELRQEAFGRLTAFLVAILEVPESFDEYVRGEPLTLVTLRPILAHLASMPRSTILELKSHWESSFDQFASAADQFERQFSRQQLLRLFESRAPYTLKQRIQSAAASETNGLTLKPNIDRERLLNIGVLCRLAEARTEPDRNHSQPDTRSAAYAWEVFRKLAESL